MYIKCTCIHTYICMYIYIYIYTYMYIYIYVYTYMYMYIQHTYQHLHMYVHIYIYPPEYEYIHHDTYIWYIYTFIYIRAGSMCVCMCMCAVLMGVFVYMCVYMCVYVYVCVYMFVRAPIPLFVCVCVNTHIHIHIYRRRQSSCLYMHNSWWKKTWLERPRVWGPNCYVIIQHTRRTRIHTIDARKTTKETDSHTHWLHRWMYQLKPKASDMLKLLKTLHMKETPLPVNDTLFVTKNTHSPE